MSKPGIVCGQTHPTNKEGIAYCNLAKGHEGDHYSVLKHTTWEDK